MSRFRKKPVEVEAVQWNDDGRFYPKFVFFTYGEGRQAWVNGRQGPVLVNPGDWIITEPDGSGHYPCAHDIFVETYEPVT